MQPTATRPGFRWSRAGVADVARNPLPAPADLPLRRSNPNEYGVNAACLEGVNPRDLDPVPWFDGVHHPADRL
jgi:hypothetical protein